MNSVGNAIFYWRSDGPNLLLGAILTSVIVAGSLLTFREPKTRWISIILCGAWCLYIPFVFISTKIWPDEVSIGMTEMHGRHNLSRFALDAADIRTMQVSSGGKGGSSLHVFLNSTKEGVGIPVIWDKNKADYKNALHKFCPSAQLDW